ncbi:M4 family metallopeptidase [Spirillospora sp. CA-108201]
MTGRVPRHWRPAPLPQRVQAVIAERLARLPGRARETLLMAALAIRPTADLLRRAGRADAARDIGHAAGPGLLITEGGGIRFTPPAVGTVLAESADAPHLARVHRALAEVVPDAAGRARHRALADPGPTAELAHSLVTAAEQAVRQGSRRMAAELYPLAADRSPAEPAAERLEWLVAAAETGASGGLPDLAHRAADAVLAADASRAQRVRVRLALLDLSGQGLTEMGELTSDIMASAMEFWANNSSDVGDYLIGEKINLRGDGAPLRYMDRPSKDGSSLDSWSPNAGNVDVHYSSGIANHFFYLLSEGSGSKVINGTTYNSPTSDGKPVTGTGREKATAIWYKAVTEEMRPTTDYADARRSTLAAAAKLYGQSSAEYAATANAWAGVNVGSRVSDPGPGDPGPGDPSGSWAAGTAYNAGDVVTYDGASYRCLQAHTALPGWTPPNVPALWQRV